MQVPGDQTRKWACLPEKYIYGWLFSIQSNSPELLKYRAECYDILYNHFHGAIAGRRDLIKERAATKAELNKVEQELAANETFRRYRELAAKDREIKQSLQKQDREFYSEQLGLFTN